MKKTLSLGLCVVLLISSLTACKATKPKQPNNEPESAINVPVEPAPEPLPELNPEQEIPQTEPVETEPITSPAEVEIQDKSADDIESIEVKTDEPQSCGETASIKPSEPTATKAPTESKSSTSTSQTQKSSDGSTLVGGGGSQGGFALPPGYVDPTTKQQDWSGYVSSEGQQLTGEERVESWKGIQ